MEFLKNIFLYQENSPLFFSQLFFWGFFFFVLVGYSFVYRQIKARSIYLLIVSLFFYYKSGGYFFSLLLFSTITDYYFAKFIHQTDSKQKKKLFLIFSLVCNLGILAYFKYTYLIIDTVNYFFDTNFNVTNLLALWSNYFMGDGYFDISTIILPVGISFYVFQTLSYTIDVYRDKLKPIDNILDFGFYVTYFPQLVAGPIVRAADFIPQIYQEYKLSKEEFYQAIFLILNGLIKKMFISDYISTNFVDRIFDNPAAYSGFENLMGIYGYAIQIYCDFSGYTDIAIGIALLMGFKLLLNFNSPYKAPNITDFWRRWHISLSSWLRDYLYISLGGNRKGKIRTYVNLMLTMLLGGLWHGAALRFIIWGGLHGAALAIHKIWVEINPFGWANRKETTFQHAINVILTFHFVCFTWIFFRAKDMNGVTTVLHQIFYNFGFLPEMLISYKAIFLTILWGFFIHWLPVSWKDFYRERFYSLPNFAKVGVAAAIIFVLYQVKSSEIQPFIYFQF